MQSYVDTLQSGSEEEIQPFLTQMEDWYSSLKAQHQQECGFTPEERLKWAKLALDFHKKGLNIDEKLACAAAIYEYCCLAGQMKGTEWSDIFAVATHFGLQKPRLLLAWKQLLQIPNKYGHN
jgi:hypothetical protein